MLFINKKHVYNCVYICIYVNMYILCVCQTLKSLYDRIPRTLFHPPIIHEDTSNYIINALAFNIIQCIQSHPSIHHPIVPSWRTGLRTCWRVSLSWCLSCRLFQDFSGTIPAEHLTNSNPAALPCQKHVPFDNTSPLQALMSSKPSLPW